MERSGLSRSNPKSHRFCRAADPEATGLKASAWDVVPLWKPGLADEIITVSAADAMAMARRLAREEGLFAGASSGANVVAALRLAARLGPEATIVTLMIDTGIKYLSTEVYREI